MSKKLHNTHTKKGDISKKGYILKEKDVRFLNAVDTVLKTHKENGIYPRSQSEISMIISSESTTISKIRSSQRGVTWEQLVAFCNYFNVDHRYFFHDHAEFHYTPKKLSSTETVNVAPGGGKFSAYIEKIKEAMSDYPLELREKCMSMIEQMQEELEKSCNEFQQLLSLARRNEKDTLKKYISLLEKLH